MNSASVSDPLISVIVPTYNSEGTIRTALESIVAQTESSFEIIVQDGGSADKTIEICHEFSGKDARIKVHTEKDEGIYDAINRGIARAQGQWIYILGSDDRLHGSNVFAQLRDNLTDPENKIVYGNVMVNGDAGWAVNGTVYDGQFDLPKLLLRNICQQAVFYRRSVFQQIGNFNKRYKVCADWDFILRCYSRFRLIYCDVIVADFTGGATSGQVKDVSFYNEFAQNMYTYFGRKILSSEFDNARTLLRNSVASGFAGDGFWSRRIIRKAARGNV